MSKLIKGKVLGWAAVKDAQIGHWWLPLIYEDSEARIVKLNARPNERFIGHRSPSTNLFVWAYYGWFVTDAQSGGVVSDKCETLAKAIASANAFIESCNYDEKRRRLRSHIGCPPEADV